MPQDNIFDAGYLLAKSINAPATAEIDGDERRFDTLRDALGFVRANGARGHVRLRSLGREEVFAGARLTDLMRTLPESRA